MEVDFVAGEGVDGYSVREGEDVTVRQQVEGDSDHA